MSRCTWSFTILLYDYEPQTFQIQKPFFAHGKPDVGIPNSCGFTSNKSLFTWLLQQLPTINDGNDEGTFCWKFSCVVLTVPELAIVYNWKTHSLFNFFHLLSFFRNVAYQRLAISWNRSITRFSTLLKKCLEICLSVIVYTQFMDDCGCWIEPTERLI